MRPLKNAQFCFSSRRAKISPIGGASRLIESSLWVVTGGASEASALRGKYIEYFEDSAEGCAVRLEKLH